MKELNLETTRHSLAHLMAAAVQKLYPAAKFGIGPTVENGFYYDFDLGENLTPEDLPKIEKEMKKLLAADLAFVKKEMSISEAVKLFKKLKQEYKMELLADLKQKGTTKIGEEEQVAGLGGKDKVTIYETGDFVDLCRGPHVKSTRELSGVAFKLVSIAGAYWRGSEKNKMLQRVYGVAFNDKKDLDQHLKLLKEAEERDHRRLGKELDLFSFDAEWGAGLPLWHPKGALLRQLIEDFWIKEHLANGYELIRTPHIAKLQLWQTSGHWDFYRENMYSPMEIEGSPYVIKPMNCPGHIKIFNSQMRSYRDLPIRWAELGTVYRFERSGVLHGLTRVRGFTQDDAHIFCRPDQLDEEVSRVLKFTLQILKVFGFNNYEIYLSTRPAKSVGTAKEWARATDALAKALKSQKLKYQEDPGEGVFYGPKIDLKIKDALGRAWQCSTLQVDFNLPQRFDINYIEKGGQKEKPIMLHRALLGSLERFVGVLIEHYAGALPLWLSPVQVQIIPVGQGHIEASQKLAEKLKTENIRVEIDDLNETVGNKIRKAEKQKIPYMLVVGDKEKDLKKVAMRARGNNKIEELDLQEFIDKIRKEIVAKK